MAEVLYAGLTFEQAVRKYYHTVASVCVLHMNNRTDAQDCFQNTFLKLFEKSPNLNDENHLKAWLIRVAINECNNYRRKNKSNISITQISENDAIIFPNNDSSDISWALVKLEPKFRQVLYLRYCEQYNATEIAKITGKNSNTVRTLIKRGKEKLKRIYGGDNE